MLFHQVQRKKKKNHQCFISKVKDAINEATIVLAVPFAIYPEYGICFRLVHKEIYIILHKKPFLKSYF